jgi:predicted peptidase
MEYTLQWRYEERVDHDYLVLPPDEYAADGRDWPMVVYLYNGGGGAEGAMAAVEPLRHESYLLLVPIFPPVPEGVPGKHVNWNMRIVGAIIERACCDFRVDEARCSLVGFSMGGSAAWALPFWYPERFERVAVISGSCHPWKLKYYPHIPVWSFSGSREEWLPQHANTVRSARQFGVDVTHTIWPGLGHGACHHRTMRYAPFHAWLRGDLDAPVQPRPD